MSSVPKLLIGLSCPGCGGTIEVTEGSRLAFCPYCGSALAITADDAGVTRLMYKMEITEAEAERSARKWFGAFPKARDLSATAVITEIFPMYLPFWRVVGTGKGVACGYSTHTDKDGHTQRTYHEDSSDAEYLWSVIACQTGDLGIATPPELKGTLLPYTDGDIPVFEITSSRDEAYDQADTDIRMEAHRRAASGIETLTFSKTFCIPVSFRSSITRTGLSATSTANAITLLSLTASREILFPGVHREIRRIRHLPQVLVQGSEVCLRVLVLPMLCFPTPSMHLPVFPVLSLVSSLFLPGTGCSGSDQRLRKESSPEV